MFFNNLQQPGAPMLPRQPMQPGLQQSLPAQVPAGMVSGGLPTMPSTMQAPSPMHSIQGGMGGPMSSGLDIQKILAMLQNSGGNSPMSGGVGSVPPPSMGMRPQQVQRPDPMAMLQQMLMRR